MDIVTHGLLGALVAQAVSHNPKLRTVTVVGALAALLPDLDVLIKSSTDPLLVLEYHRHFTHSILFAPFAALLVTLTCAPLVRQQLTKRQLYCAVLFSYLSACLLDVCTSYGTHLFWPFSQEPVALSIIAVVDPLFSAILLVAVMLAWCGRRRQRAWWGLLLALGYLAVAGFQHHRAEQAAIALAEQRALPITRVEVKPTLGNLLLWRALSVTDDRYIQVDGIWLGLDTRIYSGERRQLVEPDQLLPDTRSRSYQELLRFQRLTASLLVRHSEDPWMIGDARYAMLPTSADPLWGLLFNPEQLDSQPDFVTRRRLTPAMRQIFIDMLMGRYQPSTSIDDSL